MAALVFVVADRGDDRAPVVNAARVMEQAVPVVAFVAAIHEVAGHDIKCRIGPLSECALNQAAPAVEAVLRVAHVHE